MISNNNSIYWVSQLRMYMKSRQNSLSLFLFLPRAKERGRGENEGQKERNEEMRKNGKKGREEMP